MAGAVAAQQEHRPLVSVGRRTAPVLPKKPIPPRIEVVAPARGGGFFRVPLVLRWSSGLATSYRITRTTALSTRACCALAFLIALAGAGLRLAMPVTPPDAAYHAVVEAYPSKPLP